VRRESCQREALRTDANTPHPSAPLSEEEVEELGVKEES